MGKKPKKTFWRITRKTLKNLGILGYSKNENIFGINPFIISIIYIAITLALSAIFRKIVKLIFGDSQRITKYLLLEFIATVELCAACYELIIVADNWGVSTYAIFLFLLTVWWGTQWEDASACPYCPIEEVLEGSKNMKTAILTIASQLVGALITFKYVQVLWSLELVETHIDKAYEDCTADLQVDMSVGAVIEAIATCLCRLVSRFLSETDAAFGSYFDAFFGTMMVVAAFNFSGGYFNPALATSLKLGCDGNTLLEHVIVYWFGAIFGSILAVFIYKIKFTQNFIASMKSKVE
ncbi:unnamed protein product [Psylliodes chrysocephalus]|uniref:Aquaporin n=1 Tax=Psylliodes chrysocephalus TaxID=3402493 RepID=A0A9P0CSG9_9CUCU|nr:unnamed protein product [Psylliodes chrysocephala]